MSSAYTCSAASTPGAEFLPQDPRRPSRDHDFRKRHEPGAEANLGVFYVKDLRRADPHEAVKWFRTSAHAETRTVNSAWCYVRERQGVPKDMDQAVRLYRLAAEGGLRQGAGSLGELYEFGQRFRRISEAARWYRKAIEGGDVLSAHNWRQCFSKEGRNARLAEAIRLWSGQLTGRATRTN